MPRVKTSNILTNTGHTLSVKEDKFIDEYVKLGNGSQAVVNAGYKTKAPQQYNEM